MKYLVVVSALFLAACGSMMSVMPANAQRTGARYPALPANCPVDYVASTSNFNAADYEVLGHVTLGGYDSFTDDAKAKLQPTVCEWGGNAVTIMASAASMGTTSATFTIHRKREAAAAPVPLACTGTFVNRDGASITFDGSSTAQMVFGGNAAPCNARGAAGSKVILTCGAGSQDGSFASDCSKVNIGGLDFAKAK